MERALRNLKLFIVGLLIGGLIAAALVLAFPGNAKAEGTNTVTSSSNTVSTVTGTTTVDKTPPTASAPAITINNQDVCTSAGSAAVQTQILGVAAGVTIRDMNCERLKLSRNLYAMGMKVAAVSVLCQDERVFDAMMMAGTPCPYLGAIGQDAIDQWNLNPEKRPDYETWRVENGEIKKGITNGEGWLFGLGGLLLLLLL